MKRKTSVQFFNELKPLVFISYCQKCSKKTRQVIYQERPKATYSLRCLECKRVKQRIYTPGMLLNCVEKKEDNPLKDLMLVLFEFMLYFYCINTKKA